MTSSQATWSWTPSPSALDVDLHDVVLGVVDLDADDLRLRVGQPGESLPDLQDVRARGVRPGGLLGAVHLPQFGARVVAVLGGDAVSTGVEDDPVALPG